MAVCSDNCTKYEHIVVLTWFAHSQLFLAVGIHAFLLWNWITETMNEANMLNCKQICDKGS